MRSKYFSCWIVDVLLHQAGKSLFEVETFFRRFFRISVLNGIYLISKLEIWIIHCSRSVSLKFVANKLLAIIHHLKNMHNFYLSGNSNPVGSKRVRKIRIWSLICPLICLIHTERILIQMFWMVFFDHFLCSGYPRDSNRSPILVKWFLIYRRR